MKSAAYHRGVPLGLQSRKNKVLWAGEAVDALPNDHLENIYKQPLYKQLKIHISLTAGRTKLIDPSFYAEYACFY